MFGQQSRKDRNALSNSESAQPLLSRSQEDLVQDDSVIFAIDDEELDEHIERGSPYPERPEHNVRFEDEVQVIGPPLRSTIQSREAGAF
jgi:sodium-coupled neutral amino acid transporter 11